MTKPIDDALDLQAQYERASEYLQRCEDKLLSAIARMEKGDTPKSETAKELETITMRLERVAYKLFEIGYKLDAQHRKHQPAAGVLDLDAAKREIIERLTRGAARANAAPKAS